MAEHCAASFIYFFLFLVGSLAELDSKKSYFKFGLDNPSICHPNNRVGEINLKHYKDLAIMIEPTHVFDSWFVINNKRCKFKIKPIDGEGIFAVIQRMSFRGNGSECLDYIKFTRGDGLQSKKYCGKIDNYNGVKRYIPPPGFMESEIQNLNYGNTVNYTRGMFEEFGVGKIITDIFISQEPLRQGETLDLLVTYTPYIDCGRIEIENYKDYWAGPPYSSICMNRKFVCDGYSNCASLICSDESNCTSPVNKIISDGTGTKVTVSAVTTIFLCFIIFVLCLWICRKHKKLCWSPDCAGPSNTVSGTASGLPMESNQQTAPNPPHVATAPMLEVVVPGSVHDKDLPPSYDSLFPLQTNAANT